MAPACSLPASPDRPEAMGSLPQVAAPASGQAAMVCRKVDPVAVLCGLQAGGLVPAFSTVGPLAGSRLCGFGGGVWG